MNNIIAYKYPTHKIKIAYKNIIFLIKIKANWDEVFSATNERTGLNGVVIYLTSGGVFGEHKGILGSQLGRRRMKLFGKFLI